MFKIRPSILTFLAVFYGFVSAILVVLILISGYKSSVLPSFYFLRTDASDLNVPGALSDADLLRDISSISGVDLVGSDATASSLGLANTYTVSLLSSCAHYPGDTVRCTNPTIGYAFDPEDDLRLSSTNIVGGADHIFSYENTSKFIAAAYILGGFLVLFAPFTAFLSGRFPSAAIIGAGLSCLATVFLACASIAVVVVFPKAKDSFNDALADVGIETSVSSKLFIFTWVATMFALISAFTLFARARCAKHANVGGQRASRGFSEYQGEEYKPTKGLLSGHDNAKFTKLSSAPGSDDGMEMDPIQPKWRGEATQGTGRQQNTAYEPYSHAS